MSENGNRFQSTQLSDLTIYFPDVLDGSTMINESGPRSCYKDVIETGDTDLDYKIKAFLGVNKVVELANIFKCVYLDKYEFPFIVKDLYRRYPSICLDLLVNRRISFVDNDKFFMFYDLRNSQSFIQIHRVPKPSNDKLLEELKPISDKVLEDAMRVSFEKSIFHEEPDPKLITNKFYDDLKRGYYQGLVVGTNSIIGVDNENKQLFDLIAQTTLNLYICDLLKIESIYLKEYPYSADKIKHQFKNAIYSRRTRFDRAQVYNYSVSLALSKDKNISSHELLLEASKNAKEYVYSKYEDEYSVLRYSFSCDIKQDYAGNNVMFVKQDGEEVQLPLLSFDDYLKKLQSEGQVLRKSRLFIKVTPKKHLDSFLNGDLKFSKPIEFVGDNNKKGQKDITEAAFKSKTLNGKRICTINTYDLEFTKIWCCFALDNYMFINSMRNGVPTKKAVVKKEYYEGFLDGKDPNAIIFIKPDIFVNRIFETFINKGIAADDILICPVTYIKKAEDFMLSCEPPYELFYKDIAYLSQNEVRILIRNSGNKYDYLFDENGVINIGDLRDICTVIDGMYHSDMECFLISDSKMEFMLPE